MIETDPTGRSAHEPGAKLDAGKSLPWLVLSAFANALELVVKVGTDGATKYSPDGWLDVPNAELRYLNAAFRHLLAVMRGEYYDHTSGSPHLAHVIWNFTAVLELQERGRKTYE